MSLFCLLFWHRWRPQATECVTIWHSTRSKAAGEEAKALKTRVLMRCIGCSKAKVETLEGHWTLEQLLLGEEMSDPRTSGTRV